MKQKIQKQLDLIEKSNAWINNSLQGEKQRNAYRSLVNCRRKLNRKKYALESNPAAAVYGESQVGKSYLISSLLSEEGKPFGITDENNIVHNFIEEINPPGGGSESTGLVSRFSVNYKPVNPKFPIKVTLLSPADIVLVLCDSFYNDIKANHELALKTEQINAEVEALKANWQSRRANPGVFSEDEVLDMQDYFESNFSTKAGNVLSSKFFDEVSLLISKVEPNEWKSIFTLLWNKNEVFTTLFSTLIAEYEKLNFSDTIYLPLESVLYKHGTLLDVKRLKEIYEDPDKIESEYKPDTTVLYFENDKEHYRLFAKSYLCALAAELVFSYSETLIESKLFLKETDLLDFPGARSRMKLGEHLIETKNIPELLLRGKVAYLFNKYADAEKINILLFCAKHEQAAQRAMPEMLNNWIEKTIGETPEKREIFIDRSKIPPLFIVGTFFNVNLAFNPLQDKSEDNSSFNYRWSQRFEKTLAIEFLGAKTYQWFENWTATRPYFQNIFLLRDFEKSDSLSRIFDGYKKHKKEIKEIVPPEYPDFKEKLRKSFLEYDFVKRHFENPAESWDEAASINKDGSQLIIDKLTVAANHINAARREKIVAELNNIAQEMLVELRKYYHSADKDEELQKAKSVAGAIQLKLDMAFRGDGIKRFGPMMKELTIDEGAILKLYHERMDDIERRDVINWDKHNIIRMQVPPEAGDTVETYCERLCVHYEKTTDEQKQQFKEQLIAEKVDLEEIINGNTDRIKNFSQQLADSLIAYWLDYVSQNDKRIVKEVLPDSVLQDVLNMYQRLFKKLKIHKIIAEKIRHYVDIFGIIETSYEMIADISAEILNKCINNVGLEYFSESDINDLKQANDKNHLGLVFDKNEQIDNVNNKQKVAELLEKIDDMQAMALRNPNAVKTMPNYRNYQLWYNRLKVGFVSVCDIPNYDVHANGQLGTIIEKCETIKF